MALADTTILEGLETPDRLRLLPESELQKVADAVRAEMIDAVSVTGGHLGSGL
ncbi:1-deoxy-D-xylulose-5-phosphate synthase N-terminal domain-containing protein, partial [Methylorubrum suomiense]